MSISELREKYNSLEKAPAHHLFYHKKKYDKFSSREEDGNWMGDSWHSKWNPYFSTLYKIFNKLNEPNENWGKSRFKIIERLLDMIFKIDPKDMFEIMPLYPMFGLPYLNRHLPKNMGFIILDSFEKIDTVAGLVESLGDLATKECYSDIFGNLVGHKISKELRGFAAFSDREAKLAIHDILSAIRGKVTKYKDNKTSPGYSRVCNFLHKHEEQLITFPRRTLLLL
ncbi:MAG: hypothetical protein ABIF92_00075 [archaeon]